MSHEKALEATRLAQYDLVRDRNAYPKGPIAEGRNIYRVIGWEGADRGSLLLSEAEADAVLGSLRRAPLSAIVPDEVAGVEPAGWRWKTPVEDDYWVWSYNTVIDNPDDTRCEPLYTASTLTALAARAATAEKERDQALIDANSQAVKRIEAEQIEAKLLARAEKAEREAEAWERRTGEAIIDEATAVERVTALEAELSALRARLEEVSPCAS